MIERDDLDRVSYDVRDRIDDFEQRLSRANGRQRAELGAIIATLLAILVVQIAIWSGTPFHWWYLIVGGPLLAGAVGRAEAKAIASEHLALK